MSESSRGCAVKRRCLTRRDFLLAAVGATGLLVATPAARTSAGAESPTAPWVRRQASLAGVSLSVLQWSSFQPEIDAFFKRQVEDGFMRETGAVVTIERISQGNVQAKTAAAVEAGSGPDVIGSHQHWAHVFADHEVDVSDLAEELKQQVGEFYPAVDAHVRVNGRYLALPHGQDGSVVHWRTSWFKEAGYETLPSTFDDWHAVGKKMKAAGRPYGQSLGKSFGDPVAWCYPMLWSYGGQELDANGRVAINSPETTAAVAAMKENWVACYDEAGLTWDDVGNNRAFLAEQVAATNNATSLWHTARASNVPFFEDVGLGLLPAGPRGRFHTSGLHYYSIMSYSKQIDAAKAFLRWMMRDDVWMSWFEISAGNVGGISAQHDAIAPWVRLPPATHVVREVSQHARTIGYPGPPNQKAGLAWSKYIIVEMFARACQGESPEAAVKWAEAELKQVYEA